MTAVLAILQARTTSSRLPGKVLLPILDQPMLAYQIERIRRSRLIDQLVIATSDDPTDDGLAVLCQQLAVPCYRGSLPDVLDRFYQAALPYQPQHIVRLTGDCPLCDPELVDTMIQAHIGSQADYTSNSVQATYPDGLDVEVCRFTCLQQAWAEARLPSQREHVMPFIHQQPERFQIQHYKGAVDLSALRWTVDEPADFELVTAIYQALYPGNPEFTTQDVLTFLQQNPEWMTYNTHHQRNEGLQKSFREDALVLQNWES